MSIELTIPNDMVHPLCKAGASLGSGIRSVGLYPCVAPLLAGLFQFREALQRFCSEIEFCVPLKYDLCFLVRL